jgi:uracil-DNA glycosylase
MDAIIKSVMDNEEHPVTYALTNIVACIPKVKGLNDLVEEVSPPPLEAIDACKERLVEFIELARPAAIVRVGKPAQQHVTKDMIHGTAVVADIVHPSFILQSLAPSRPLMIQRCVAEIRRVCAEIPPF